MVVVVSSSQRAIDVLEDDARLIVVAPVYEVILVIRVLETVGRVT